MYGMKLKTKSKLH